MNNKELEIALSPKLNELQNLNENAIKIARALIGESLFKTDLYFCALLNKSIQLTDGFVELIKKRNLTSAGIILRSSMDNCLRLYAMFIANNPDEVVDCLISGGRIDKLKDKDGNKLRDSYLKNKLGEYDNRFVLVYNNASGYVHFSEKGFYQSVSALEGDYEIGIQVSHAIPEKANDFILECVQAYIFVLELFYSMFKDIISVKKEYDDRHKEV